MTKPGCNPVRRLWGEDYTSHNGIIYKRYGDKWHKVYANDFRFRVGVPPGMTPDQAEAVLDRIAAEQVMERLGVMA